MNPCTHCKDYYEKGAGGTSNHALLNNLTYALSGHTGFQATIPSYVISFNGRNNTVTPQANDYTWQQINMTVSDIKNITTRQHTDLTNLDYASSGHTGFQATLGYTAEDTANKGVANGYAGLDASGKVPLSNLTNNTDTSAGIVKSGSGQNSKVWKTDASGVPDWRNDASGATLGTALVQNPYATNVTVTQAHGLAAIPDVLNIYLTCKTAELGYSAGQVIKWNGIVDTGTSTGFIVCADATNLYLRTGISAPRIIRWDNSTEATITAGNWNITAVPIKF